jgi:hypothetical protein
MEISELKDQFKDQDKHIRELENKLVFIKAVSAIGLVVIFAFLGVTNFYTIPNAAEEAIKIKLGFETSETINEVISRAEKLSQKVYWPKGSYAILKHGGCPVGFREVTGQIRAISVFAYPSYVSEADFGDSEIKWHQQPKSMADLKLSVCVKDK